jgi:hypothetical protein
MNLFQNIFRQKNNISEIQISQEILLIAVIELDFPNSEIEIPKIYPYWENTEMWDKYHMKCQEKVGFQDRLNPYLKGSNFYQLSEITNKNLTKIVIDHTKELLDGKYERQQACAFSGGYVLRINGIDEYFPQCCGELSDIKYWENISIGKETYYEGHPAPQLKFEKNYVTLDFTVDEYDEFFQPKMNHNILKINLSELKKAVEKVKNELNTFEKRLNEINLNENLNIENIGNLFICENLNYK